MCRLIDRLASEKGLLREDANCVFAFVTEHLINKVPALKQIIEDVFEESEDDKIKADIEKMITPLQQKHMERFKTWQMPDAAFIRQTGCQYIL